MGVQNFSFRTLFDSYRELLLTFRFRLIIVRSVAANFQNFARCCNDCVMWCRYILVCTETNFKKLQIVVLTSLLKKAEQKSIRIQLFANVTEAWKDASTKRKIGISITLLNCCHKFTVNFVKAIMFHLRSMRRSGRNNQSKGETRMKQMKRTRNLWKIYRCVSKLCLS